MFCFTKRFFSKSYFDKDFKIFFLIFAEFLHLAFLSCRLKKNLIRLRLVFRAWLRHKLNLTLSRFAPCGIKRTPLSARTKLYLKLNVRFFCAKMTRRRPRQNVPPQKSLGKPAWRKCWVSGSVCVHSLHLV